MKAGVAAAGAALLAAASLARISAAVAFAGVALRALVRSLAERTLALEPAQRRFAAGALAGSARLLALGVRRAEDRESTVPAVGLVPVALEPSGYYSAVPASFALLWKRHASLGVALCRLSATGWWIAGRWRGYDESRTRISVATLLFAAYATALFAFAPGSAPRA